jgi:spore maturation protein A
MRRMSAHSQGRFTADMGMFIILNCSSVQLIPTTMISLRAQAGSLSAQDIFLPSLLTTLCTTVFGVLAALFYIRATKRT